MTTITDTLESIGGFSARNPGKIFAITILALLLAFAGASQLQMEMGMDLYIDEESQVNQDWQEIQQDFNKGNVIFVMVESDEGLYRPENAEKIAGLYETYYDELKYGDIEAASLITSFSHPIKAGPGGGEIPETRDQVINSLDFSFNQHRSNMGIIANLHPDIQNSQEYEKVQTELENENFPVQTEDAEQMFADSNTAVFMIQYGDVEIPEDQEDRFGGLLPVSEDEIMEQRVKEITSEHDLPGNSEITYTGTPVFEEAAFGLMLPEMIKLFAIAFSVIFATVFLLMRNKLRQKRDIMMPLATSLTAVFIMAGTMGVLGFNFNAIMLGVLPVALGLSIDYSLQIHSRYIEERENGIEPVEAAQTASRHVGKALLIAMTTTAIGLGALLISSVPPTRQFGATAIIAIGGAMALSITLLPALLVKYDKEAKNNKKTKGMEEKVSSLFEKLESYRNPLLGIGLLLVMLGAFAAPQVATTNDMLDYWPEIEEREDIRELENRLPAPNINYVIIENEEAYTLEHFEEIQNFQHEIEKHENIVTVMSAARGMEVGNSQPPVSPPGEDQLPSEEEFEDALEHRTNVDRPPQLGLTPEDHPEKAIVQVFIEDIEGETEREVIDFIQNTADDELENSESRVTGEMVLNRNVIENVTSGLLPMTALSFLLGLSFLTVALKSFKDSAMIIGSVAVSSVLMLTGAMYILGIPWNPLTVTISAIILGLGIDYGVHIHERYKEEKLKGLTPVTSMKTSLAQKSRPILASGITTLLGFGVLAVSDFPVLANFGYAIILAMSLVIASTCILLPATILTGEKINQLG